MAAKTGAPKRSRRKKVAAASRGLTPVECAAGASEASRTIAGQIEACGGSLLATYREPLGGEVLALAALPIDKVSPTPFQRDLSETHARRLSLTIDKLGRYLDPIVAVPEAEGFWTPNGRHRLEAMKRLGAKTIVALISPDPEIQYRILALNVEKAHNLREKSLEVIRVCRAMVAARDRSAESQHALEFEEPAFLTLGICYERNGRFGGGAYRPILVRVDGWLDEPLREALEKREGRAVRIERLDQRVSEVVKALQARGLKSPYLKSFVVARVNPLRFMKTMPPFDRALDDIQKRADRFQVEKVSQQDLASVAGIAPDEE